MHHCEIGWGHFLFACLWFKSWRLFLFIIGYERNPHVIYLIFLFYRVFHGMLKWNSNNAGCKEALEPSGAVVCLEQDFCHHQCIWIRPAGLDTPRCGNLQGWRVYSCALTSYSIELPCKCCDSSLCPVWISHARLSCIVMFLSLWTRPWLRHLSSFSPRWKQSSDCPFLFMSEKCELSKAHPVGSGSWTSSYPDNPLCSLSSSWCVQFLLAILFHVFGLSTLPCCTLSLWFGLSAFILGERRKMQNIRKMLRNLLGIFFKTQVGWSLNTEKKNITKGTKTTNNPPQAFPVTSHLYLAGKILLSDLIFEITKISE